MYGQHTIRGVLFVVVDRVIAVIAVGERSRLMGSLLNTAVSRCDDLFLDVVAGHFRVTDDGGASEAKRQQTREKTQLRLCDSTALSVITSRHVIMMQQSVLPPIG